MCKLILRKRPKHIGLVFLRVGRFFEQIAVAVFFNSCIVAGCHRIATKLNGGVEQGAEFQVLVAENAGIGGKTVEILGNEAVDNLTFKGICIGENAKRHIQFMRDIGRTSDVFIKMRSTDGRKMRIVFCRHTHGHTYAIFMFFFYQVSGDAGIDASAQGDKDTFHCLPQ